MVWTAKTKMRSKPKPAGRQLTIDMTNPSPASSGFPGHPPGEESPSQSLEVHTSTSRINPSHQKDSPTLEVHISALRQLDSSPVGLNNRKDTADSDVNSKKSSSSRGSRREPQSSPGPPPGLTQPPWMGDSSPGSKVDRMSPFNAPHNSLGYEIGRASCRERVSWGVF